MKAKLIKDRTVKEIFEAHLGVEAATTVITKIQKGYDRGLRDDKLRKYAESAINETGIAESASGRIVAVSIAIIVI
jgi:hypothetical protein